MIGGMEITITLDEEMAAKLEVEAQKRGTDPPAVVSFALQRLFNAESPETPRKPFEIRTFDIGFNPGVSLDCTGRLLETLDLLDELERWKRSDHP